MIKLFATDLDGTLLSDNHIVSAKDANAIHALLNKGVIVIISTGRAFDSCKFAIKNIDFHKYIDKNYIIAYNGANIFELQSGMVIYSVPLMLSVVDIVCRIAKDFPVNPQVYTAKTMYVNADSKRIRNYVNYTGVNFAIAKDFLSINEPITKVLLNGEPDVLSEVESILAPLVVNSANMFYSQPDYLEFVDKKIDKSVALSYICDMLGVSSDETFTIGDNFNDIPMLKWSKLSCCPQNAVHEAKLAATYVTESSNNNSAVAEAINSFILSD